VDSRIFSVDWLAAPFSKLQISGTWIYGQNFASLAVSNDFLLKRRSSDARA